MDESNIIMNIKCPKCKEEYPFKEISKQLGKMNKGKKKRFSKEELAKRTAVLLESRHLGGRKKKVDTLSEDRQNDDVSVSEDTKGIELEAYQANIKAITNVMSDEMSTSLPSQEVELMPEKCPDVCPDTESEQEFKPSWEK